MTPDSIALRLAFTSLFLLVLATLAVKYVMTDAFAERHHVAAELITFALVALFFVTCCAILGAVWLT